MSRLSKVNWYGMTKGNTTRWNNWKSSWWNKIGNFRGPPIVDLFPNWVVKHIRSPKLKSEDYLKRQVEVVYVDPKVRARVRLPLPKMRVPRPRRSLLQAEHPRGLPPVR